MKRIGRIAKAHGITVAITEGGNHTKVHLGDRTLVVPRHAEIGEGLAAKILKQAEGK